MAPLRADTVLYSFDPPEQRLFLFLGTEINFVSISCSGLSNFMELLFKSLKFY